jgi:hypothetical protein
MTNNLITKLVWKNVTVNMSVTQKTLHVEKTNTGVMGLVGHRDLTTAENSVTGNNESFARGTS